jgi:hypothetical protein
LAILLLLAPIQGILKQFAHEVALSDAAPQRVNTRLRPPRALAAYRRYRGLPQSAEGCSVILRLGVRNGARRGDANDRLPVPITIAH